MSTARSYTKPVLRAVADCVLHQKRLRPEDIEYLSGFSMDTTEPALVRFLNASALPLSVTIGALFAMYPEVFDAAFAQLPSWTNLSDRLLAGLDYVWNIVGEPVGKHNILFHIPNFALYSFGIIGIKMLVDTLRHKGWLDIVLRAQEQLRVQLADGTLFYQLSNGHTLLFVGKGDYIGAQFSISLNPADTITLSEHKPAYTSVWSRFRVGNPYADLTAALDRGQAETADYLCQAR